MKFNKRPPTDAELTAWLDTGKPSWIDRLLDDADVTARLEQLTALPEDHAELLENAFAPDADTIRRIHVTVSERVSDLERVATIVGLLGLGAKTARALSNRGEPPSIGFTT